MSHTPPCTVSISPAMKHLGN